MGRMTPIQTTMMTKVKVMRCRWNRRYWTASLPHFCKNLSSLRVKMEMTQAKKLLSSARRASSVAAALV